MKSQLRALLQKTLGTVAWDKPDWVQRACAKPRQVLIVLGGLLAVFAAAWGWHYWFEHRPYSPLVTVKFNELQIPAPADTAQEPPAFMSRK